MQILIFFFKYIFYLCKLANVFAQRVSIRIRHDTKIYQNSSQPISPDDIYATFDLSSRKLELKLRHIQATKRRTKTWMPGCMFVFCSQQQCSRFKAACMLTDLKRALVYTASLIMTERRATLFTVRVLSSHVDSTSLL